MKIIRTEGDGKKGTCTVRVISWPGELQDIMIIFLRAETAKLI